MKKVLGMVFGFMVIGISAVGYADDRTGMLSLNYVLGPSLVMGGSDVRDVAWLEPGVGAALQYGVSRNLDFLFAYDYIDADLRSQALTFNGQWRFAPDQTYCPIAGFGMGFGKPYTTEDWGHFSMKLTGGIERALTPDISLAALVNYQYIQGPDPLGSIHVLEPVLRLTYHFADLGRSTPHRMASSSEAYEPEPSHPQTSRGAKRR